MLISVTCLQGIGGSAGVADCAPDLSKDLFAYVCGPESAISGHSKAIWRRRSGLIFGTDLSCMFDQEMAGSGGSENNGSEAGSQASLEDGDFDRYVLSHSTVKWHACCLLTK